MMIIAIGISKLVGISAGVLTGASMLPQLIKVLKEKKVSQVSVVMLLLLVSGLALWVWYGFVLEDWPIIITNMFSLLVNIVMIFLRYRYRNNKS